jgi:hypothetical protein
MCDEKRRNRTQGCPGGAGIVPAADLTLNLIYRLSHPGTEEGILNGAGGTKVISGLPLLYEFVMSLLDILTGFSLPFGGVRRCVNRSK